MDGLGNVGPVHKVVVGVAELAVACLHGVEETVQDLGVDLELGDEVVLLQQLVAYVLEAVVLRRLVYREHVEGPVVQVLGNGIQTKHSYLGEFIR